jgi:hypothetical protein
MGDVSNALQPLCYCSARELVLGSHGSAGAFVCQVCRLYEPDGNVTINEVYKKSKKMAEKKVPLVKEVKHEEIELEFEKIDLDVSEFEEEEEEEVEIIKYKKRSKGTAKPTSKKEYGELTSECPYCGDFFEDLSAHMAICEFAPSEKEMAGSNKTTSKGRMKKEADTQKGDVCPYCGKTFIRLSKHKCKKAPKE